MLITKKTGVRGLIRRIERCIDRETPVTISYVDKKGDDTVRTIEPVEIRTTGDGEIMIVALCRLRGECRQFNVTAIWGYTLHIRSAYILDHDTDENTDDQAEPPATVAELIARELGRDSDLADDPELTELANTLAAQIPA